MKMGMSTFSRRYFPNVETVGYFDFFNQLVTLNAFDKESVSNMQKASSAQALSVNETRHLRSFASTAQHELTHWLDLSSTIWGIKLLISLYSSQRTFFIEKQESKFVEIKAFGRSMQLITYPKYYNEEHPKTSEHPKPWRYQFSSGQLFDRNGKLADEPILFTNFANGNNEKFVRYPICTGAVLEGAALAQEFLIDLLLNERLDENTKLVEERVVEREWMDRLYHRDLLIYSTTPHLVSNSLKIPDVHRTLKVTAVLSRFVLNFPTILFPALKVDGGKYQIWGNRPSRAMANENRAFLFFLLLENLKLNGSSIGDYSESAIRDSAISAMASFGVTLDQIEKCFEEEQAQLISVISKLFSELEAFTGSDYFKPFINAIASNLAAIGLWGQSQYDFSKLQTPPILLGDNTLYQFPNSMKFDLEQHYENMYVVEKKISEFLEACI
jgi:hypothetical protein